MAEPESPQTPPVHTKDFLSFDLKSQGTNWSRELIAGITMFLATAYTVVVIPSMLGAAGLPRPATTTCVLIVIILGTLAMGVFSNLPIVLAPGLGGVSLVAFTLVQDGGVGYGVAMGIVFWSGVAFLLLTVFGIRGIVTKVIPEPIRLAIGPAIGIFITFIGFRSAGLVVAGKNSLRLGHMDSPGALLAIAGVIVLIALNARKVRGSFIIVIVALALIGIPLGSTKVPHTLFGTPTAPGNLALDIDFVHSLSPKYLPYLFVFFASEFFSTTGVVMTVTSEIKRSLGLDHEIDLKRPFLVDSASIIGGSLLAAPSVTTYVESTAGAEAGGHTGVSSLWAAACFAVLLVATPLATAIPAVATAPVVIVVGLMITAGFRRIRGDDLTDLAPAVLTLVCTILWGNFGSGIAAGLLSYVLVKVCAGRWRQIHPGLWVMTPFLIYFFASL